MNDSKLYLAHESQILGKITQNMNDLGKPINTIDHVLKKKHTHTHSKKGRSSRPCRSVPFPSLRELHEFSPQEPNN